MKIHTYHADVAGMIDSPKLIELWKTSWERAGWVAVVLTKDDAMNHPQYNELVDHYHANLPTINPKQYELACYERWLAMAWLGGGWLADSDVMNWSFFPNQPESNDLTIYNKAGICPCLVHGGLNQYQMGVNIFLAHNGSALHPNHASDQDILCLHSDKIKHSRIVHQYGEAGWENACLVHFNNQSMTGKQPRHEWIPKIRPLT
jgi:hypothetical protein